MMIDIDFYKDSEKIIITDENYKEKISKKQAEIIDKIEDYALLNDLRFRIYRTRNGIHAFLINRYANYTNYHDLKIMLDLGCDFFYIAYSRIRGWSVRLNRKEKEEKIKYNLICDVGDVEPIENLVKLTDFHIDLISVFENSGPSKMFGN